MLELLDESEQSAKGLTSNAIVSAYPEGKKHHNNDIKIVFFSFVAVVFRADIQQPVFNIGVQK